MSPGNAQIYNSIALLYRKQNKNDSALHNYQLAYQFNNENLSVLVDMADLYRDMSQPDSAVKYLHEAIRLRPEIADLYNSVGVVYLKYKQYDSAAEAEVIRIAAEVERQRGLPFK